MIYLKVVGYPYKEYTCNLPTNFMSIFPLPTDVANRTEKLQHDFL